MSDRQAAAVRRLAERGGRVVAIGELGTRTEDYIPRKESLLQQITAVPAFRDRVVSLPSSCVLEFRDLKREPIQAERTFVAMRDAMRPPHPLIESSAPKTLWMTLWRDAGDSGGASQRGDSEVGE